MIPMAGSAYTYSYATMGELVAWIIGWDLILEYAIGAATVGIAWSEYLNKLLEYVGLHIPYAWSHSPFESCDDASGAVLDARDHERAGAVHRARAELLLIRGIRESAFVNGLIVITKVAIVAAVHRDRLGLHQPRQPRPVHPARRHLRRRQGCRTLRRPDGDPGRGRRRVLRVHRLRRGVDRGAGGEEAEARHADRHPRLAGDLHGALHPVRARADRRGVGAGVPHPGQGGVGRLRDHDVHARLRLAGEVRDRRRSWPGSRRSSW